MRRVILNVLLAMGIVWFMLVGAIALLMSSGLADEPGDTKGFRRFLLLAPFSLPGLGVAIVCGAILRRDRNARQRGFPIDVSEGPTNDLSERRAK